MIFHFKNAAKCSEFIKNNVNKWEKIFLIFILNICINCIKLHWHNF